MKLKDQLRQLGFLEVVAQDEMAAYRSLFGEDPQMLEPDELEDPDIDWGPNPSPGGEADER